MSDKKINFNDALSFIEELPDEVLTTIVGGAGSATPTATSSGNSRLGNLKNASKGSSTKVAAAYDPKGSNRQH